MDFGLDPQGQRRRIAALHYWREQYRLRLEQASPAQRASLEKAIALLRAGVFPPELSTRERRASGKIPVYFDQSPLSSAELMTFNCFFVLHPEKVAGQEIITSSRDFPLSIQGGRAEVEATIDRSLQNTNPLEAEAQALALELELMEL